ncbi:hypothetical protein BGX34_011711 [Mortierella sp. NVP85]|nr:hypothetical protein BGX34_011711 [Mortierella sp. NVP85]
MGHMAMGYPPAQGFDVANQKADGIIHAFMGFEGKPFPCGGYGKGAVTTLKAGEIINVRFWNFDMKKENYGQMPYKEGLKSARHGGGACEFSLSYDGGKKWGVIAQYTKSCPDIYYEWPVLIPPNIRECKNSNKCLFSWSWVAAKIGQFYHHCSNVIIEGSPTGIVPSLNMTVVDTPDLGQKDDTTAEGDGITGKGQGPDPKEIAYNKGDNYSKPGAKGIDLLLNTKRDKSKDRED